MLITPIQDLVPSGTWADVSPGTALDNGRERFLNAAWTKATDRPPIWMMRQAGRCLPEYRALREKHSFLELVQAPELACEVTLQPIRRFGFDAAILFSDILVVPEAMGQKYHFRDTGGIEMEFAIRGAGDIERLSNEAIDEKLDYVFKALRLIKSQLGNRTALLGFAGSPWTLANFMLEGGSTKTPVRALQLLTENHALFDSLMQKLTTAITTFLRLQLDAGVDAIQLFDSLGGLLPSESFEAGSGRWLRQIIRGIDGEVPIIVFSKGTRDWKTLFTLGANVIGLDDAFDLSNAHRIFPIDLAIQGNLSPEMLLHLTPSELEGRTTAMLKTMTGRDGYIFNLGHGVLPATPLENIATVVQTVQEFQQEGSPQPE